MEARSRKESRCLLFVGLAIGVFLTFVLYAIVEESIFRFEDSSSRKFAFGWFLTTSQFGIDAVLYGVVRFAWQRNRGPGSARAGNPFRTYAVLSLLIVTTMGLSNAANAHLSYPIKVRVVFRLFGFGC